MTDRRAFSDQDLSAYLDSEAPAELSRAIDAALKRDAVLQGRVADMKAGQEAFVAAMQTALAGAPDMPDLPPPPAQRPAWPWQAGLGGVAVGAVAALGLTWATWRTPDSDWRDVVANYQSLYVTETLAQVNIAPQVQQADLQHMSEKLGIDLTNLPEVAGLSFKRVQHLGYKGRPLAQLTFLTADGGPVALCVLQTGAGSTPEIVKHELSGLDSYSWSDNGFGVVLVGPKGQEGLRDAAELFRKALRQAPA